MSKFLIYLTLFWFIGLSFGQEMPHEQMDMPCQTCHNTDEWRKVSFDHSKTDFPMEGNHRELDCRSCHDLRNFKSIRSDCRNCHTDFHQGRLGPWCQSCHSPLGWTVIDPIKAHANTTFPLLGVHARLDCAACHYTEIEGEYSLLKSECYSCHREDYSSVQSPNHQASGFPLQCENCHGFYAWKPAQFVQHDGIFPIFSGTHSGEWNSCTDCHINPGDFSTFSCLNCHEHRRDRMDREHDEVSGYRYDSNACYNCHPTGGEGGD